MFAEFGRWVPLLQASLQPLENIKMLYRSWAKGDKTLSEWLCIFHRRVAALWDSFISKDDSLIVQCCRSSEKSIQPWIAHWTCCLTGHNRSGWVSITWRRCKMPNAQHKRRAIFKSRISPPARSELNNCKTHRRPPQNLRSTTKYSSPLWSKVHKAACG